MHYTAVIRAKNESAALGSLLKDLSVQSLQPTEIILVDSGSEDNTVDIAREYGCTVLLLAPELFTYGRSLNLGFSRAGTEFVVSLSAHVRLLSYEHTETLLSPLAETDVVATYGRQIPIATASISERNVLAQWFPVSPESAVDTPFINNANAAYKRSAWLQLPFDEDLPGLEDVHFATRARERGLRTVYVPAATIEHHHHESWQQTKARYLREARTLELVSPGSGLTMASAIGMGARNIAHDLREAGQEESLIRSIRGVVTYRTAQFLGAWQGGRQTRRSGAELRERVYGAPRRGRRGGGTKHASKLSQPAAEGLSP